MTEFGEALNEAINQKDNTTEFVWRDQNGTNVKMIDMDEVALQKAYTHCNDMLFNRNQYSPGRWQIKKNIQKIYDNCNAELFVRYLLHDCDISSIRTNKDLFELISLHRKENGVVNSDYITTIFKSVPTVYEKVTIENLLDACLDKLDVLNRKIISDKFIINQGIWLTNDEKEELTEYDDQGKFRNRLDVIKERLVLNNVRLRIDPKGLSYTEFRSLIKLEPFTKISDLPTVTLKLLRDKVLLLLDNDIDHSIEQWTELKEEIEKIAEDKGYELETKEY